MSSYEEEIKILADKSDYHFPFLLDADGKKIHLLFQHQGNKKMASLIWDRLQCQACRSRVKKLSRYTNNSGDPLFLSSSKKEKIVGYDDLFAAQEEVVATPIIGIKILMSERWMENLERHEGDFDHYHIDLGEDHKSECDQDLADLYGKAFRRYLPIQMAKLINTLLPNDKRPRRQRFEDMLASLELMEKCLPKIPYGEKLEHSVAWLLRIVRTFQERNRFLSELTPNQQWMTMARILFWTHISPDGLHNAVSPIFQQAANNLIPVLGDARDEKALIAILTQRLCPTKYQRPSITKELSVGAIQNASQVLGAFTNRVMTLEEAGKLPDAIKLGSATSTSTSGFQKMLEEKAMHKSKAPYAFAARSTSSKITTVKELLVSLEQDPNQALTVEVSGASPICLYETTLAAPLRSVPYFWAFLGDKTFLTRHSRKEHEEVAVIVPQWKHTTYKNTFFILKNPIRPTTVSNCCFPEFLSIQHRRTCRDAFERLNKEDMMKPAIGETVAIGVGISATNTNGDLHTPLVIHLNGVKHKLTK